DAAFNSPGDITNMCTSAMVSFTITIQPSPNIAGLESNEYCNEQEIKIALPALQDADKRYQLDFYSGTNLGLDIVPGATGDTVTTTDGYVHNPYNRTLVGTYALTVYDVNDPTDKVTTYFTVTVYPTPNIDDLKEIVTVNGALVPDYLFTGNVQDGIYKWTLITAPAGVTHNLPLYGDGNRLPSFTAQNNTDSVLTFEYSVSAFSQKSGECDEVSDTLVITIYPTPTVAGLENQVYCHDEAITITLPAPETYNYYKLAFVSGTNLSLALNADGVTISGTANNTTSKAISGVYSVTSYDKVSSIPGEAVYFIVTVNPELKASEIIIADKTYFNGERVPEICFPSPLEGVEYVWTLVSGDEIGSNVSGRNCIPEFIAVNTTDADLVATYEVEIVKGNCVSNDVKTFTVTVTPNIIDTKNLYATVSKASQTVCFDGVFESINLKLNHRTMDISDEDVIFEWTLQGNDVIGQGASGRFESTGANVYSWDFDVVGIGVEAGTGIYTVTPIWNNYIGAPITFTLAREVEPTIKGIQNVILCNNSPLSVDFISTTASKFRWEVKEPSQLGIPNEGLNTGLYVDHLVNNTDDVITETIIVTPINVNECEGDSVEFTVTVLPKVKVDQIATIFEGFGVNVPEIEFEGVATEYRWASSNPLISTNPAAITSGTGNFPAFTTTIVETTPVVNMVTVTPVYTYDNFSCTGESMQFAIIIAPEPVIEHIDDIEVCEGERIPVTNFSLLNANSNYKIAYEFSEYIGLDDDDNRRAIPSFETVYAGDGFEKQTVTVTVTPRFEMGDIKYSGKAITYNITVYPQLILEDIPSIVTNICHGTSIELEVLIAAGYEPAIQWYKDGVAIPGADAKNSIYYATESGLYYAVVTSKCGEETGSNHKIDMSYDVISQRWNDVLTINMETSINGGHTFTDIKWYKVGSEAVLGTLSYLGNVSVGESYYFTANGGSFVSCEYTVVERETVNFSVEPNPVRAGEYIRVTGATGVIYVINSQGSVVNSVVASGDDVTEIKMPKTTGIYVVYINNNGKTEAINVIVK
ncbi:hypothetical protein LJB95_03405, partial [Paludibacteraceae bacterium OttesenSCG-928-F17]|nr:hypothetical protein [Paludibacteraceae bacterium OttesenSCG-928-F17]